MPTPYVGEIRLFAGNFAPDGWFFCQGQQLAISEHTVLFALIGTTYGGDGVTTFNLPNLSSRIPVHQGQGPGLSPYVIGQLGGAEQVTLLPNQVGAHSHLMTCTASAGTSNSPAGAVLAAASSAMYAAGSPNGTMASQTIGAAGGGLPHENRPPSLALNFIIAYAGIFPSRN